MYNTILVPLDGSKRAEKILPHVEQLSHCFSSKVVFLQVVNLPNVIGYGELFRQGIKQLTKQAESYLSALKRDFQEKGIKAKTYVANGPAVKEIIDSAELEDADLIAMTSHGKTGLARAFYGSVAVGVLHLTDRPLIIIRSRVDY